MSSALPACPERYGSTGRALTMIWSANLSRMSRRLMCASRAARAPTSVACTLISESQSHISHTRSWASGRAAGGRSTS